MQRLRKPDNIIILTVVLCLIVLVGEYSVYGSDVHRYDVNAEVNGGTIDYSVSSSGNDAYSAILLENKGFTAISTLYIYIDPTYDRYYDVACADSNDDYANQSYYAERIKEALKIRGFSDVRLCDDVELHSILSDGDNTAGTGLMVISYALPESVYSGSGDDILIGWMNAGGSLYWVGSETGRYYVSDDGLHTVQGNQGLFFGKECVNTGTTSFAYSMIDAGGLSAALSLKNSNVRYGLDTSGLDDSFSLGYSEDGYSSISFVKYGSGMICVVAEAYSIGQTDDIAQVIASGITYCTEVVEIQSSITGKNTVHGTMGIISSAHNLHIYVYLGGIYTVYGEAIYV